MARAVGERLVAIRTTSDFELYIKKLLKMVYIYCVKNSISIGPVVESEAVR